MSENKKKEEEKPVVAKTAIDLQRLKLQKLMKNPEKPIILPERPKSKNTPTVPEFVRNVMGSSAGAGSGEFHVYRHLRRKEYARQKFIQEKGRKELLDTEYHEKLEDNKRMAEEITAKKRAKRLKKKQKWKKKKQIKVEKAEQHNKYEDSNSEGESSDERQTGNKNDNEPKAACNDKSENNTIEDNKDVQGTSALCVNESLDENDVSEIVGTSEVSNHECKKANSSVNIVESRDSDAENVYINETDTNS